jgi:hypothetical protein
MNQRITKLVRQALKDSVSIRVESVIAGSIDGHGIIEIPNSFAEKFAELIVRECIDKIETHQIPVGNSAAGEMACEWTYDALKEIRNAIKEHFGVQE